MQVPIYFCPTRRAPPQTSKDGDRRGTIGHRSGALGDYGVCVGDGTSYDWPPETNNGAFLVARGKINGRFIQNLGDCPGFDPCFSYEGVQTVYYRRLNSFPDGLSNTFFVGEKHVTTTLLGLDQGFDTSIYNGDSMWPLGRFAGPGTPLAKSAEDSSCYSGGRLCPQFGSDHPGVCHFGLGDGSVHALSVHISTDILRRLAVRNDEQPIPAGVLK